jgi:hypothetical protein
MYTCIYIAHLVVEPDLQLLDLQDKHTQVHARRHTRARARAQRHARLSVQAIRRTGYLRGTHGVLTGYSRVLTGYSRARAEPHLVVDVADRLQERLEQHLPRGVLCEYCRGTV